jgi:hypothetical protein
LEAGCSFSKLEELGGWSHGRIPARYRAFVRERQERDTPDIEWE